MEALSRHSLAALGWIQTLFAERATFCGVFGPTAWASCSETST